MGDSTGISWTDATWNPWIGCHKVSEECRWCYFMEELKRKKMDPLHVHRTKPQTFNRPLRWAKKGHRLVFTCSWGDWFHPEADSWREEAWEIVRRTPELTYQILTKRPEGILARLPNDWDGGYPNVWLGVSVGLNDYVSRADILRIVPAKTRFISAEPLLGPLPDLNLERIDWCILGGESGVKGRPRTCDGQWMLDILGRAPTTCSMYVKQLGNKFIWNGIPFKGKGKNAKLDRFPTELQVQKLPKNTRRRMKKAS